MNEVFLASAAAAEDAPAPQAGESAATTTTQPDRERMRVYGAGRAGEPAGLPTGLPGYGSPGMPPPTPEGQKEPPKPSHAP